MAARWGTRSPSYLSRCVMPRARLVVKQRDYRKPLPDDIRRRGTVAAISAIYSRRLRTESLHRQIAPAPKFGARRQTESRPKAGGVDEGPVVQGDDRLRCAERKFASDFVSFRFCP
jgi:hypothetical protein